MSIELKPLSPHIGLEVIGVDLTRPLDPAVEEQIREAWIRAGVLLFRGAGTSQEAHMRLSSVFGEEGSTAFAATEPLT